MLLPMSWLRQYVETEVSTKEIADKITSTGTHVESIIIRGQDLKNIVTGKIIKIEEHPNADKLVICYVDIGDSEKVIVTGAKNVFEGAIVPVALDGAVLANGMKIKTTDFRGVQSEGMMCSLEEVGFDISVIPREFRDGIHILPENTELGISYMDVLELNEEVLELEITPNRPDCLSILGLALETAATLGKSFELPKIKVTENSDKKINELFNGVEITTDNAARFYARALTDVNIKPSPQWLQNELMASGVRPIVNIVDLTNFVMLEYGQPLHAYDLETLTDKKIIVRDAKEGEVLTTLDNVDRKLRSEDIVIADGSGAIGLAGIMGGLDTEITENTKTVLLEGAYFNEDQIRRTAKHFNLRTEASNRFEKGLDPEKSKEAVDRICELAVEIGCAKVAQGSIDNYPKPAEKKIITSSVKNINRLLGTEISGKSMSEYLNNLLLETKLDGDTMTTTVPTFRRDIKIWQDLSEEVGRMYGFHNIKAKPLEGVLTRGGKPKFRQVENVAKEVLLAAGFDEFMTYSFMSPSAFDRISIPDTSKLRDTVSILNPLGEEYSVMRTTLLPNMINVFLRNASYRNEEVYGFEFGNVFSPDLTEENLPIESMNLAIGFYGNKDFYFLKDVIDHILKNLGITGVEYTRNELNSLFHTGRCANVMLKDKRLGTFGELHPKVAKDIGMHNKLYLAELDFDALVALYNEEIIYEPVPKYPAITRDFALIVDRDLEVGEIVKTAVDNGSDLLESCEIFDVYTGDQVDEDKKSVAISLVFRSKERTLVEEEVNALAQKITTAFRDAFDAKLRS